MFNTIQLNWVHGQKCTNFIHFIILVNLQNICVYVCMYVCMYIYIHIYTHRMRERERESERVRVRVLGGREAGY